MYPATMNEEERPELVWDPERQRPISDAGAPSSLSSRYSALVLNDLLVLDLCDERRGIASLLGPEYRRRCSVHTFRSQGSEYFADRVAPQRLITRCEMIQIAGNRTS